MKQYIKGNRTDKLSDFISVSAEMWIETEPTPPARTEFYFISVSAEMWIETRLVSAFSRGDAHFISVSAEMWIETFTMKFKPEDVK